MNPVTRNTSIARAPATSAAYTTYIVRRFIVRGPRGRWHPSAAAASPDPLELLLPLLQSVMENCSGRSGPAMQGGLAGLQIFGQETEKVVLFLELPDANPVIGCGEYK